MPYAIPSPGGAARDGQDTEEASTECFRSRPLARLVGGHEARSEAPAKASLAPVADLSIGDHLQDFVCFCCLVSQCPVVCRLYVPGILRILRAPLRWYPEAILRKPSITWKGRAGPRVS